MEFSVEVIATGGDTWVVALTGPTEVGREGQLVIKDPRVSRRHLRLEPTESGVVVTDLGSRGGTIANGQAIQGPVTCNEGDWLLIGGTYLRIHAGPPAAPTAATTAAPTGATTTPPTAAPAPVAASQASTGPAGDGYEVAMTDGVVRIHYRPGSAGAQHLKALANTARQIRKRLEGFGSESSGVIPDVWLVDPFTDPSDPDRLLTEGTIVVADKAEIWMVVTGEAPPEPLERPLTLLFGGAVPAADELEPLLEGYGLWLAKAPPPDEQLQQFDLPPLALAEGELRAAMALSFVSFLIKREREAALRTFFETAQPNAVDAAMQQQFGLGTEALERAWREHVASGGPTVKTGQFLRLSLRYLKPHKWKQGEIFVYMLFALAFNMVFPFVTRNLFDTALPSGEFSQVATLLGGLAIALAISLAAGLRQAYLSAWVSSAVVRDMRTAMFTKLQSLPTPWYRRHQQGDVLTRLFSDVQIVETGLTSTLRDGLFQMLSMVVSTVVMLILSPLLGVIVLLAAPLVAIVYKSMSKGARTRGLAVQEDTAGLMNVAAENYQAEPVVKLFSLQGREVARFDQLSARLFRSERRLSLFGGLFGLSVNSIVTILRLAILGIGAWMILNGSFTVGGLVAFLGIMGEVLAPVTVLTGIGQQIQAASGSLHRIDEITEEPPEFVDQPEHVTLSPLASELRLSDVDFAYTTERQVLDGVSAVIPAGRRVAFVGPSGSGKSTIFQLLMRLYDTDEGGITWDGIDVRTARVASLRAQLGVVFQESFLFDASVRENIRLGKPDATDEEVLAAAQAAEVDAFVSSLPRGYDTAVGERGGMLSGGQRQRVAIARALIRNPNVLLLDEATSALDPKTERQITATLNRISVGRTTIAITHRLTSVTDYDLIFVLHEGRIVEQGTHESLLAGGGMYARLWSEQTGQPVAIAGPPPFDARPALARVPFLAGLTPDQLDLVAARLQTVSISAGESVSDATGSLVCLASGRARALVPGLGGEWSVAAELGPGDTFGVSAILGAGGTGSWLQAIDVCDLRVLTGDALTELSTTLPALGRALTPGATAGGPAPAPASGRQLTRMTRSLRLEDVQQALAAAAGGGGAGPDTAATPALVGAPGATAIPTPEAPVRDDGGAPPRVFPRSRH